LIKNKKPYLKIDWKPFKKNVLFLDKNILIWKEVISYFILNWIYDIPLNKNIKW